MRLYHNPRCSKSRQAVKLLTDKGVSFQEHRYLEEGIMEEDLPILASLVWIVRKQEKEFKELDFAVNSNRILFIKLKSFQKSIINQII